MLENIAKDRKVIPDPIDDRKFQEWKEKWQKNANRNLQDYKINEFLNFLNLNIEKEEIKLPKLKIWKR